MLAYTGGAMRVAGWRHPVVLDLAGLSVPSQNRPIRFAHDPAAGVGHTDAIRVEGGQLVATGVISRDTATAREVVASSRNGFPWQASVGASVEEFEFIRESQKAIVNGSSSAAPSTWSARRRSARSASSTSGPTAHQRFHRRPSGRGRRR